MKVYLYQFYRKSTREIIDVIAPDQATAKEELKLLTPFYESFVLL